MAKKKQEYYSLEAILKNECQYYMIIGMRSNGKSYAVKKRMLENSIKFNKKFMLLRRYTDDVRKAYVSTYFGDMEKELKTISKGMYNNFKYANGNIYVEFINEEDKQTDVLHIGYYRSLSQAERMKSNSYEDVEEVVFEEFIATGNYLPNEINLFESVISTIARRRKIKVFLIGNTISRNCIYFQHFSLVKVPKQKQGTIDIYTQKTDQYDEDTGENIEIKIAVEMCQDNSNNTKMFFGNNQKAIAKGDWTSELQPTIDIEKHHNQVQTMVFEYRFSKFLATLYCNENTGDLFWYVEPKTTSIKKNTRVISDIINESSMYSSYLNPLTNSERYIFNLFKVGKIFYSSNLVGTEFKEALRFFINNIL